MALHENWGMRFLPWKWLTMFIHSMGHWPIPTVYNMLYHIVDITLHQSKSNMEDYNPFCEIFHIEEWIVYGIESNIMPIQNMRKYTMSNCNRYVEGFILGNLYFDIIWLFPNITYVFSTSWALPEIYFHWF